MPNGELLVQGGVELSEDGLSLVWPMYPRTKSKSVKPTPMMFSRFIDLREGTAKEIQAFAKQWGRLWVRQDGKFILGGGYDVEEASYREPLEAWRYLASRAYAVLSIAAELKQHRPGDPRDWAQLSSLFSRFASADLLRLASGAFPSQFRILVERGFAAFATAPVETQRALLTIELNLWMTLGGLGLFLGLDAAEQWQLELFFRGRLLAAIALQLVLTVSGVESPRLCSGCKQLYIRTKKDPKSGEANYCDRCVKTEPGRQADKRRRERAQEARRLHVAEGKSVSEIAKVLNVRKLRTVKGWIAKGK